MLFYFSTFSLNGYLNVKVIIGTRIMRDGIGTITASVILCVALYCVASVGIRNVVLEIAGPAL